MLRLVLVETKENYVLFYYYPENKEDYGIIEVKGDEINMVKNDSSKMSCYKNHAVGAIRKQMVAGCFKSQTVAWY